MAGHGALERAGGADRQQAGRQQEARVEEQPRDNEGTLSEANNEGLMKRFDITRERRGEERDGSPSSGKEPSLCDPNTHVNKPRLPKDSQLRYKLSHIQKPTKQKTFMHLYLKFVLSSNLMYDDMH